MIEIAVPDYATLTLEHLVLDYNGTLACDGTLLPGVRERLRILADRLTLHVLTADTFGTAKSELEDIPCQLTVLPSEGQAEAKAAHVRQLGAETTVCIGNGRNDRLMVEAAVLGIAVLQEEGAAKECLIAARVVCRDIRDALDLLRLPLRLTATLRG
jgi:soluble P-type ATPase